MLEVAIAILVLCYQVHATDVRKKRSSNDEEGSLSTTTQLYNVNSASSQLTGASLTESNATTNQAIISRSLDNCVTIDANGFWWVHESRNLRIYTIYYICEYRLLDAIPSRPPIVDVTSLSTNPSRTESDTTVDTGDIITDALNVEKHDQDNDATDFDITFYVAIPVAVAALCGAAGVIWCVMRWIHIRTNEKDEIETLELSPILTTMLDEDVQMKLRDLLLHRSALELEQVQGRGAFGIVYKGLYSPTNDTQSAQSVAVKVLQANCIGSDICGLVDEAVTMTDFNHAHVMSIIGVCLDPDEGLPMLVMPYMENADLNSYLRRFIFEKIECQIPDEKQLLLFCLHIARGMEYLSGLKFLHRDLAARNCMIDANLVVKVADFGLSRDVYTSSYYRQDEQKMLPVKWMSLESLQYGVFTSHSDMWSFGVTIWEILSLGRIPYPAVDNNGMLKHLETGARLTSPKNCPDEIYAIMVSCWRSNVEERPTFSAIAEQLTSYLARTCGYLELNIEATTSMHEETTEEFNIYSGDDKDSEDTDTYKGDNLYTDNNDMDNADNGDHRKNDLNDTDNVARYI